MEEKDTKLEKRDIFSELSNDLKDYLTELYEKSDDKMKDALSLVFGEDKLVNKGLTWSDIIKRDLGGALVTSHSKPTSFGWDTTIELSHVYPTSVTRKMVAMYKIMRLIEFGYGGYPTLADIGSTKKIYAIKAHYFIGKRTYSIVQVYDTIEFPMFYSQEAANVFLKVNEKELDDYFSDED